MTCLKKTQADCRKSEKEKYAQKEIKEKLNIYGLIKLKTSAQQRK